MKYPIQFIFLLFAFKNVLSAHQLPPGFVAVQIADGLDPVDMAIAPDGRVFLTEKYGRVLIVDNGEIQTDPFLEIEVDNFNERGLSGIAIDPDFDSNGFVYIYYTVPGEDHNRISRFTASGNFALPDSEFILMDLDSLSGPHHNAGAMDFGPDGKLYVAVGDGFSTEVSQDLNSTLGKILRLNSDGTIPTDNPFYDQTSGNARATWALGFRNPFAMTVDHNSGRFFATEVGSFRFEEINEIQAGRNYGWPITEGYLDGQVPPPNYTEPIHVYGHLDGCAAVGVEVYAPQNMLFPSEYFGQIFYSDYCNGKISILNPDNGETTDFANEVDRPLNLLTAPDGTLYFIARGGLEGGSATANTASSNGQLWRIFYTGNDAPFISIQPKDQLVPLGENALFETSASGAEPLFFQWQKDGVDIPGATSSVYLFESPSLADDGSVFRCIVTNDEGSDTTQVAEIQVTTNQRPTVEITEPIEGTTYRAGDALVFRGVATDPEDGAVATENYRWKIDFHHDNHTHPALGPLNSSTGDTLFIPKAGEVSDNVWFRINFTATDEGGLSQTTQRLIFPEKTKFTVKTQPIGLPIETNGNLSQTPYIEPSVIGVLHQLKAPQTALTTDSIYTFERWSNGETERQIIFDAPEEETEITAIFRAESALADGQGLQAFYFDDPVESSEYTVPFAFSQIDPQINFDWGDDSPNSAELGDDFYLIRWTGFVQPLTTGEINFHTISDDGVRLWIDSTLIIDKWVGQVQTEHTGSIFLEAEKFYPIQLEYFESIGDASVQLLWSGENLERAFVPSSQLFPNIRLVPEEDFSIRVFPNPVSSLLKVEMGSQLEKQVDIRLFNANGQLLYSQKLNLEEGFLTEQIDLSNFPQGVYFLSVDGEGISEVIEVVK